MKRSIIPTLSVAALIGLFAGIHAPAIVDRPALAIAAESENKIHLLLARARQQSPFAKGNRAKKTRLYGARSHMGTL